MKHFTRDKNKINILDKAASCIANGILRSQRWFATCLQGLTKNWKRKQQWVFLYLICLVFGAVSIMAIVRPFRTSESFNSILQTSISIPKNNYKEQGTFLITKKEVQQVQAYKNSHPNLQNERQGLYDSLSFIEQIYYSQQK